MSQLFTFHPSIVIRTPTSPFLTEINERTIREHLSDPCFTEALYLASPALYQQSQKWLQGAITDGREADRILLSLAKYLNRKRSRCTPFGLFATSGVLSWGEKTQVTLGKIKRRTRFSMSFLETLTQSLASHPVIYPQLYYYPNSSLYTIGNEVRYVEYSSQEGRRTYQISAIVRSEEIIDVIAACRRGLRYDDIIGKLTDQHIEKADAVMFVDALIEAQLLVSELEPTVTGEDLLLRVKRVLQRNYHECPKEPVGSLIELLEALEAQLQRLDEPEEPNLPIYRAITDQVDQLALSFSDTELFQVNAFRSTTHSTLDRRWQEKLEHALEVLVYLSPATKNHALEEFKRQFYNRYEEAEMPLLSVLDTETGIGYGTVGKGSNSSLIEGLTATDTDDLAPPSFRSATEQWLRRKVNTSQRQGYATIKVSKKDINYLPAEAYTLPTSTSVIFRCIDPDTLYLEGVSGAGAVNLLGRFANDHEDIHQLAQDIAYTEQERNPDVILAEIVHLPERRTGNILRRPLLRHYELPYLAQSSLPDDQQITLRDLFVSVRKGRVVLRSRYLDKEIIPRLSTAHNYAYESLPVYQFLCDLQTQEVTTRLNLPWHPAYYNTKRLPRLQYDRVILGVATWHLAQDDFRSLYEAAPSARLSCFEEFRKEWGLPTRFVLADNDREFLVDTEHWLTVQAWVETIEGRESILLKEFLFAPQESVVTDGSAQAYTSQCIASLIRTDATYPATPVVKHDGSSVVQRVFTLGSEWLYYKFYCGTRSSDKVLIEAIAPLVNTLLHEELIDQWFFVRYADPDNHLRVRFHLPDVSQLNQVITITHHYVKDYEISGHIWKNNTDAYRREIERYGATSMLLSEQLFFADSTEVLHILTQTNEDTTQNQRWLEGLRTINTLLNEFGYSLADKYQFMKKAGEKFYEEFKIDKTLKRRIDAKYRNHREAIVETLQKNSESATHRIVASIRSLAQQHQLTVEPDYLVGSFIHMHVNRLISSNPRLHELVMYDFLSRYYRSEIAKNKAG